MVIENKQGVLEELKHHITSMPILFQPDQDICFQLKTHASRYATGAVLSQLCDDDRWHLVEFTSNILNEAERNYESHNKELLLVI